MGTDNKQRLLTIKSKLVEKGVHLDPPMVPEAVREFEERHHIDLPEEYRLFLLEIGNGGDGPPKFGLMKLGKVPKNFPYPAPDALSNISKPFPLTRYWIWEGEDEDKPELKEDIRHGSIVLGDDGCGMYWLLIVTGQERGKVWQLTDTGIQPCAPPRDFLSWYEYWLDGNDDWWAGFDPES